MMSPTLGEGGSAKRRQNSISPFIKMGDKGEGGIKNLKKYVTSFMDGPLSSTFLRCWQRIKIHLPKSCHDTINSLSYREPFFFLCDSHIYIFPIISWPRD